MNYINYMFYLSFTRKIIKVTIITFSILGIVFIACYINSVIALFSHNLNNYLLFSFRKFFYFFSGIPYLTVTNLMDALQKAQ
jgi:hypothetical protein